MLLITSTIFCFEGKKLIFIYNAKSGLVKEMIDFAHKIVSPETYECNLCAISYNTFTKKKRWSDYINSLPIKSVFTYKNKVSSLDKELSNLEFPTILLRNGVELNEIISRNEINNINNINQLISLLNERLDENGMELKKGKDKNITEQEWEKKLTPEEFHILRERELKSLIRVSMISLIKKACINALVVVLNYFLLLQSMILDAGGLRFMKLYLIKLKRQRITHLA